MGPTPVEQHRWPGHQSASYIQVFAPPIPLKLLTTGTFWTIALHIEWIYAPAKHQLAARWD